MTSHPPLPLPVRPRVRRAAGSALLLCAALAAAAAFVPAAPARAEGGLPFLKGGSRPLKAEPTRITSDRLEFDYHNMVALFEGHVIVTDPQFRLTTDKMLVFFENSNDVKRVDCVGHVDMTSDDIRCRSGRAAYTRENAQVLLQDEPVVTKGEGEEKQTVSGEIIRVWLNDERVVVENGVGVEGRTGSFKD